MGGEKGRYKVLMVREVVLRMELPFAVIPLIHFTRNRERMGSFANKPWVKVLAWSCAAIIVGLNIKLLAGGIMDWIDAAPHYRVLIISLLAPLAIGLGMLLLWVTL